ncbi:MAG: 23S rRNA (uracil(1939)-C(5))-methyltransferase RlmD [Lachnospiraceae bacterium]|nr:23S rRNA (uracil(1939)-C(5))-methyltransferase RlmD [Lachnospiraceae bacterium]
MEKNNSKQTKSACPVVGQCGGCTLLDVPYDKQLENKKKYLNKLLGSYCKVDEVIGMKNPFHYRNKVHAVFGMSRKKPVCGIYKAGSHDIIPVNNCLIENEKASAIIKTIAKLCPSFKIRNYDEDTGYGLLRHVLIRVGHNSGEIMVTLVIVSPVFPSKNNFVKALTKEHPEITTIVLNINDRRTSMILGDREQVIFGKGYIVDSLCGKTFKISSKSFYQVNSTQTEVLYNKAMEFAGLTGKEKVLDAYCGTGTIGLIASDKAKEVIGVESNKDAVKDAINNAKHNGVKNARFIAADAGKFMVDASAKGEKFDLVFMDPPRAGSDEAFLSSIEKLAPKKIVYVSCNPETLARDLKHLTKNGYRVIKAVGVDMFSQTEHSETIALIERIRNAKEYIQIGIDAEDYYRIKDSKKE